MSKTSLSGFPEWLPEGRIVENYVLEKIRQGFELHGFANIETRAVEPVSELLRKGETSKEIYLLRRLQEDPVKAAEDPRQIGLHFDLTVPFARYVLENRARLNFPFKRYQIQKVWRGERPQDGRFREFTQADIDIVGDGELPFFHEVEVAVVMARVLSSLPLPPVHIRVNNRKIVQGYCEALGIENVEGALRALDKLDKIGPGGVASEMEELSFSTKAQEKLLQMAQIKGDGSTVRSRIQELQVSSELLEQGLDELTQLLDQASRRVPGLVQADLSIARGLDYYTGTVYETTVEGHENLGSICSGGRYDSLATDGKRTYPGVGMSIGVSRLVSRIISGELATASRKVPSAVLVAVTNEEHREDSNKVADALRERGICADTAPKAAKFGKQIKAADQRGIPYVWFPDSSEVKNIITGEQVQADPLSWKPDEQYLVPQVTANN
ncbi:MAG: histidine--tRNA ligase [Winkia neuii]|uniref:Histidine--tRNA ligase n=1 Tax=Winkia neuii TaxID=33007 RepID=A0A2I1IL86_9ACTO|nr:histidine--tRNA ligase [Winkia neuii]OFJ70202.1 histidine--tRNA ligase [Actinomyces sp. HMSC064C12]OFK04392.1 histidine--tRNA ligase [Actinomyces sp. HMSC072A03]OFT56358.1 histidine--tRNA ligase [Actinomyces sp. HMSC06A08]KWZ72076.1 histidine--tRNA ligase [Winkia neuii]MDK8099960.1 histidine--tRNA ligase [Winkia neuii]